jgi:hypothetical protein
MLKPGGYLYIEDIGFKKFIEDFGQKERFMREQPHLANSGVFWYCIRDMLIGAGFEICEFHNVTQLTSEGCWDRAEKFCTILKNEEQDLDPVEVHYYSLFGKSQPHILNDLRHLTKEEISRRWPLVSSEVVDVDEEIFGPNASHDDFCAFRLVARKI